MASKYDVEFRNVTKTFGDFTAVNDVNLEVQKGEFLTLLGPSGCGKSTSLRMIAGFHHPTTGEILVGGEVMGSRPPYRRGSSMVFQDYALFPHMSVFDNIAFGLKERRESKKKLKDKVNSILETVELSEFRDRRAPLLSGGQQQRVALARSLVLEPTVLLLDEPLGALDLKMRRQMQVEIKRLQEQIGITFIYVTHDQEEALVMSDRIAVMNNGRVEQIGTSQELYEVPATRFVAGFVGDTNLISGNMKTLCEDSAGIFWNGKTLLGRPRSKFEIGDHACISIRPEKIWSGNQTNGCETILDAKVRDIVYKGSIVRYELQIHEDITLNYDVQIRHRAIQFSIGDDILVGWSADDAVIIEDT